MKIYKFRAYHKEDDEVSGIGLRTFYVKSKTEPEKVKESLQSRGYFAIDFMGELNCIEVE